MAEGWREAEFAGSGPVEISNGVLEIGMGEQLTGVAWKEKLPQTTNYQVEIEAMKLDGSDFFLGLTFPYKDTACSLILGGWGGGVMGISSINGQDASQNETTDYMRFEKNHWYKIVVRVTDASIQAFLDGKRIVNLNTQDKKIGIRFGVDAFLPFGIGTYQTRAQYRNLKWTSLDGPSKADLKKGYNLIETVVYNESEDIELLEKFKDLRVAEISDALDRFGLADRQIMDPGIHPLWVDPENFEHRLTGVAITARYVPSQSPAHRASSHEDFVQWAAETQDRETPGVFIPLIHKGTVFIVEESGKSGGVIGIDDLMNWRSNGCLGVITSMGVRDTDAVAAAKIPVYFRKPGHGLLAGRYQLESVNRPVVCGDVQVKPGDVIVADGDGVAVVPRGMAEKVAEFARFIHRRN